MASPDIIKSAAKFLQTPANPERPLEEKIRFLIKEKGLTQYQLIAALKQANLYSIDSIEPILRMHYFEQHEHEQHKAKTQKKHKSHATPPPGPTQPPSTPSTASSSSSRWSPWWSAAATIGMGVASALASYTVSSTASQNLVKNSEQRTNEKLDAVKTEIKEQADLDRERQHRDLMEVVSLLKTQVQCVQQNLGVLKQSIEVIQTQMKYNSLNANASASSVIMPSTMHNRALVAPDDRSSISSNLSMHDESKPNLAVIGNLLAQNDDGLDWMNQPIATPAKRSDVEHDEKQSSDEKVKSEQKHDEHDEDAVDEETVDVASSMDNEAEMEIIYHADYKDMIQTLPTEIIEIKQQLTDLLNMWQRKVAKKEDDLSVDKIKAGIHSLNFYLNKIIKKPFLEPTRKINTYNKQYRERLGALPRIDTLFTLIGFEKDNVFWTLPLLYKENASDESSESSEQNKQYHEKQIEFLAAFKSVLSNLFNLDGRLPFDLSEGIQKIKQAREDKTKKKEEDEPELKQDANELEKQKDTMQQAQQPLLAQQEHNSHGDEMESGGNVEESNVNIEKNAPETKYSNRFMEIAQMVAQGKTPDDVQKIDDMPPDPNAAPSESKMSPQKKPFEQAAASKHEQQLTHDDDTGLSWFEQYEAKQTTSNENVDQSNQDGTSV